MIFKLVLTRFSDLSYKTEIKIKNRIKILVFNSVSNRVKNILIRFDTELKNILMWFYFGFMLVLFRFLTWFFNSVDRIKNQIKNQIKNRIKRARFYFGFLIHCSELKTKTKTEIKTSDLFWFLFFNMVSHVNFERKSKLLWLQFKN